MKSLVIWLFRIPKFIAGGINYHLGGFLYTPKPRMVQFPVCDRCNARCMMCNRWQKNAKKEIDLKKINEVFANQLFSKVENVHLHGGEPTLRKDLSDICGIIQNACPRLKHLSISTNGLNPGRIEARVNEILDVLNFKKLDLLELSVSIDGLDEVHDKIRGVNGGFKQGVETIQILKKLEKNYPFKLSVSTIILPSNLHQIDEIEAFAKNLDVPINFQPLMFDKFFNINCGDDLKFEKKDRKKLVEIIEIKLTKGLSTKSYYWRDFLSMVDGGSRMSPCAFDRYVLSLYPTGEVLPCSREDWILFGNVYDHPVDEIWYSKKANEIRKRMKRKVCPTCTFYCGVEFSLQKEFFSYLWFFLRNQIRNICRK